MRGCSVALAVLMVILPVRSPAAENGAILRTQGRVLLDGNPALPSVAIFPPAVITTEKNSTAFIEATGSRIEINEESVIEYDGNEVRLEHGSLSVLTFQGLIVKVGCIVATPVNNEETHFEVTDRIGQVIVSAIKNDVYIEENASRNSKLVTHSARSGRTTVLQGQQKSRDEKCSAPEVTTRTIPPVTGAFLNSPYTQGVAAGTIVGVLCWVFCGNSSPVSPSVP